MADVSSFLKLTNQVHLIVVNIWSDPRGFESHSSHRFIFLFEYISRGALQGVSFALDR